MNAPARFAILATLACATGCATAPPGESSYPSAPSSSYSGGTSAPSSPGVPTHESVSAGIVVRPDLLCVPFAIRTLDADPDQAVATAQSLANAMAQRFTAIAGGGTLRMRGIAVAPTYGRGKSKEEKETPTYALVADGAFEVTLPATLDFWGRTKLVAALVAASKKEGNVVFDAPQLRVADPESHRPKLTKQWVDRARAFGEAAQSPTAPLALSDCTAPGEIVQRSISTEEVALTLTVACKLDVHAK